MAVGELQIIKPQAVSQSVMAMTILGFQKIRQISGWFFNLKWWQYFNQKRKRRIKC
jgi:ABC-type antimicrobial peptide transport system ATPase subunit